MNGEWILETRDLVKQFNEFVAVNGVSLRVARGTIHALIGPNGAGKTTVFNLLTRFLPVTRGEIRLRGEDITERRARPRSPAAAWSGPSRSRRSSRRLTALENVRVALQRQLGTSFRFWRSERSLSVARRPRARELLAAVGLEAHRDTVRSSCRTAASGRSSSRPRSRSSPRCCSSTSRPPAWATRTSGAWSSSSGGSPRAAPCSWSSTTSRWWPTSRTASPCSRAARVLAEGSYAEVSKDPAVLEAYIGAAP